METPLHALKLVIGVLVIWYAFPALGDADPMWATVSMVVVASAPTSTLSASFQRLVNTSIGCVAGLAALLLLGAKIWAMCVAIAVVAVACSTIFGSPQRWTIAPVTTVIVMAQAVLSRSAAVGMHTAAKRFGEVLAGSLVAVVLSAIFLHLAPRKASSPKDQDGADRGE